MLRFLRAPYRLLFFVAVTGTLVASYLITRLWRRGDMQRGLIWRRRWMNTVPLHMGIRARFENDVPAFDAPALFVSNHRSYLDPIILGNKVQGIVIGKHEVSRWPLIGLAAKAAGVLFVKREKKSSRKAVVEAMKEVMTQGLSILNYPEGTTASQPALLDFRPGSFRIAAEMGRPVIPIAVEYDDPEDAWIDDDTFLRHFFQCFGKRNVTARVAFGPVLYHENFEVLSEKARGWIATRLQTWYHPEPTNQQAV